MAGLPSVQARHLEALRQAPPADPAVVPVKPKASAVASMTPSGVAVPAQGPRDEGAAIDPNNFAVDPVAAPSAPPANQGGEIVHGEEEEPVERNWQVESETNYRRWKTVSGMYEKTKSDLEALQGRFDDLSGTVEALKKPTPVAATPVVHSKELVSLLADNEKQYEEAVPVVEKLARAIAQEMFDKAVSPLQAKIEALEANTGNISKTQVMNDEASFIGRVREKYKKFDAMVQSPDWVEYVKRRVPFSSKTFGEALIDAHKSRDFDRVSEIVDGFKAPEKATLESLETPSARRDAVDPANNARGAKPTLKWSARQKANEDFVKGRITRDKLDQINAMYHEAEAERRIDYNK